MKIPSIVTKVLTNKYVLYIVAFLAITNVLGYMVMGNSTAVLFFAIVAYLISNFSQNMTIVLGAALILTNVLIVGKIVKEGMETKTDPTSTSTKDAGKKPPSDIISPEPTDGNSGDTTLVTSSTSATSPTTGAGEGMNGMGKKGRNHSRVDYASTIEDAYGDLSNILDSEGIKNLTNDTKGLMDQQLQLAEAMNNMTPLMENAKKMLGGLNMDDVGGLGDIINKLGGDKKK
jgi:hypothetical protein